MQTDKHTNPEGAEQLTEEQKRVLDARKKLTDKYASTSIRIGGKGTPRRKVKVVHHASTGNDKQTKEVIKKLQAQPLQELNEVNLFTNDLKVIQFKNPEVYGNLPNQIFIVCGNGEEKQVKDNFAEFITQLSKPQLDQLKNLAAVDASAKKTKTEEAPQLVNFEEASKK